ncbi:hypothetical protein HPP92_018349 [Vanilla planifolia]|uniref:Ubiquitin-like protease family profile domain-containing protein n=1 Tax=Vanilla planifolia TaxID=51239 RepID=A0A835UNV6_VANPL|nr:hypothetical protein HPP92_018960 [Vanilla planifolia]KAG0469021.1 hypothetical protein HPP92_018349 [Vanilla planifolia]
MARKKATTVSSQQKENAVDDLCSGEVDTIANDVEFPQMQWRCYLSYFMITMGNWKIDDRKWALLRRNPFGKLVIDILQLEVNLELVDTLLGLWDEEHCGFLIGGSIIKFTADDVALITGLSNRGLKVVRKGGLKHDEQKIPFSRIYLNLTGIVRSLDKVISNREDPHPEEDRLFVQLMILFLWGTVLFPSASRTVPTYLSHYVEDLDAIGSYNWAEFLHLYLVKEINAKVKVLKKRNERESVVPGYISGLSFIVKVWFFEHVDFGEDSGPSNPDVSPRMLKWVKTSKFWQRKPLLDRLKEIVHAKILYRLLPDDDEHELLSQPCMEEVPSHGDCPCDNTRADQPLAGNYGVMGSGVGVEYHAIEQDVRESKDTIRGSKEETSEASELRRLNKVVDSLVHTVHLMHDHLERISDLENKVVKLETLAVLKGWELKEIINVTDDLCGCVDKHNNVEEDIKINKGKVDEQDDQLAENFYEVCMKGDVERILKSDLAACPSRNGIGKAKCHAVAAPQEDILHLKLSCIASGVKSGCNKHGKRKLPMTREHLLRKKKKKLLKKQASMPNTECPPMPEKETDVFINLEDYAGPTKPKKGLQSVSLSYVGRQLLPEDERTYLDAFCLKPMLRDQIVFFDQNIVIRRQSMLQYLLGGCTDEEIINAYAHILHERTNERFGKFESFLYLSPLFMGLYHNNLGSYKRLMKAVDKKSLEKVHFLFLPCHVSSSNHWMLLVCDSKKQKCTALDSLYDPRHREVAMEQNLILGEYLYHEHGFDIRCWSLEYKRACPQQDSGTLDCGVFVMKYMESLISSRGKIDFLAVDARLFRPQIAYNILRRA